MTTKNTAARGQTKAKVPSSVIFEFPAPDAREVNLVGSFNDWDRDANPMKKNRSGLWRATVKLDPGCYEYRILVDGKWENDPSCSSCVSNEFGSMNCIMKVE